MLGFLLIAHLTFQNAPPGNAIVPYPERPEKPELPDLRRQRLEVVVGEPELREEGEAPYLRQSRPSTAADMREEDSVHPSNADLGSLY